MSGPCRWPGIISFSPPGWSSAPTRLARKLGLGDLPGLRAEQSQGSKVNHAQTLLTRTEQLLSRYPHHEAAGLCTSEQLDL